MQLIASFSYWLLSFMLFFFWYVIIKINSEGLGEMAQLLRVLVALTDLGSNSQLSHGGSAIPECMVHIHTQNKSKRKCF